MEYNNDNYQESNLGEITEKRPTGLTVLCVLTFIGSGFTLLSYFFFFALYNTIPDTMLMMAEMVGEPLGKTYENLANMFISSPQYSFLLMTLPSLFALIGAAIMLNMRKLGFHLYVVGQILVIVFPMLLLKNEFSISGLLLALLFVALYAIFYKKMR
jgi:hypothetical protein